MSSAASALAAGRDRTSPITFVVHDEYGRTRVDELSEDGVATEKFEVAGDVFKWERLR